MSLEGVTSDAGFANLDQVLALPVDFSVPVGQLLGVPFTVTVQQVLNLKTAFTAKSSRIAGRGEYSFGGALGFGYRKGSWQVDTPRGLTARTKFTETLSGLSIGVNGLIVAYRPRFYVGIGALGFSAGLWFRLTFAIGVTQGLGRRAAHPGHYPGGALPQRPVHRHGRRGDRVQHPVLRRGRRQRLPVDLHPDPNTQGRRDPPRPSGLRVQQVRRRARPGVLPMKGTPMRNHLLVVSRL